MQIQKCWWIIKKREVHITPLNSSPSLIYTPQLQYHLLYTPNSQNQAEFNPPLPVDRFNPVDRFWHVDWVNSNKKIKKYFGFSNEWTVNSKKKLEIKFNKQFRFFTWWIVNSKNTFFQKKRIIFAWTIFQRVMSVTIFSLFGHFSGLSTKKIYQPELLTVSCKYNSEKKFP